MSNGKKTTRDDKYWRLNVYRASTGDIAIVTPETTSGRRTTWRVGFGYRQTRRYSGFADKFQALLFVSHKLGHSMQFMNWSPYD